MFKCQNCGANVPPSTPLTLITVELREKTYPLRPVIYPPEAPAHLKRRHKTLKVNKRISDEEKEKRRWLPDPGGHGFEISKQVKVCPVCATELKERRPVVIKAEESDMTSVR